MNVRQLPISDFAPANGGIVSEVFGYLNDGNLHWAIPAIGDESWGIQSLTQQCIIDVLGTREKVLDLCARMAKESRIANAVVPPHQLIDLADCTQ